jgi:MIP family channel proteins
MNKYLAEFIGTFALVFVGAGSACVPGASLITIALAHGLTVATMIYALGHISGIHLNPTVTISMLVSRKISVPDAIAYIVSQLLGATLAGFMLFRVFPMTSLGATQIAANLTPFMGGCLEAVGTFLFLTVIFGAAVDGRTAGNLAGLAIGLSLSSLIMVFGPLTGASFNFARTFGPAVAQGDWKNIMVYALAPLIGGILAALVQTGFFMREQPAKPQASSYKP